MANTIFRQYDTRWGSKPYPVAKSSFSANGCGCCACAHLVIEKEKYKKYTPESLRPWMIKQGFAIANAGTTHGGITKTLQHYGYKPVLIGEADPMTKAWKELNKKNRMGIILFSGGSKGGVTWTLGGHYVAFTNYKYENNKHYFYMKDSGPRKHDGWFCYETQMKGLVYMMWIVKKEKKATTVSSNQSTKKLEYNKIPENGVWDVVTTAATQIYLKTPVDGIVSSQSKTNTKYLPGMSKKSWEFVTVGRGSKMIKALQKLIGAKQTGIMDKSSVIYLQKFLNKKELYDGKIDGIAGSKTVKGWQKWLNKFAKSDSNAEKIAKAAEKLAWPYGTDQKKWSYKTGKPTDLCKSKMKQYMNKTKKIDISDCGYFVSTAVMYSGVLKKYNCLKGFDWEYNSKLPVVHKGAIGNFKLQRGDIIRYKKTNGGQHTMIYLGDGKIAEAGRGARFGVIRKSTKYNGASVKKETLEVLRSK